MSDPPTPKSAWVEVIPSTPIATAMAPSRCSPQRRRARRCAGRRGGGGGRRESPALHATAKCQTSGSASGRPRALRRRSARPARRRGSRRRTARHRGATGPILGRSRSSYHARARRRSLRGRRRTPPWAGHRGSPARGHQPSGGRSRSAGSHPSAKARPDPPADRRREGARAAPGGPSLPLRVCGHRGAESGGAVRLSARDRRDARRGLAAGATWRGRRRRVAWTRRDGRRDGDPMPTRSTHGRRLHKGRWSRRRPRPACRRQAVATSGRIADRHLGEG